MNQNTIEQQQIKINALRKEAREGMERLFDNKEEREEKIGEFVTQLEALEENGVVSNKEDIIRELNVGAKIADREAFIAHFLKILDPIIIAKVTRPHVFSKIERNQVMGEPDTIKLSEFLYGRKDDWIGDKEEAYIHLTSATDFMNREGIEDFKSEIVKGLTQLAIRVKEYPNMKKIWAASWLVAVPSWRKRIEGLGFMYHGPITEEERTKYFQGDTRPIEKAFITREDLLARFGHN